MISENEIINVLKYKPKWIKQPYWWIGHLHFAYFIINSLKPKIFVELGTHGGNSYFSFCQSVQENALKTECFAVDTWTGDEHAGFYENKVFESVSEFNEKNFNSFSKLKQKRFDEALNEFDNNSIDLLHIDGHHSYEAVSNDFNSWLPKLSPGAVVLFHDIGFKGNGFGVWKLWDEIKQLYPDNCEFKHYSGLGVIQIAKDSESKKISWLNKNTSQQQLVLALFEEFANLYANYFIKLNEGNESPEAKYKNNYIMKIWNLIKSEQ
jgi:hypothetical protein